ncbi:MAG: thioredoxin-disulfide reductase [Bdellovibrionaceae bacterium]|nr:thioredoxin-disulfide reductase [Pseudobdellovibrionaceae bacterium]
MSVESVIIIGSGPAGYTAAIYTARANLSPLVIEGYQVGGQLMLTSDVENYPGFPDGIMGPEMMPLFRKQAERFGTRFLQKDVTKVDFTGPVHKVYCGETVYEAKAVIIATGASAKWLGLPSEQKLMAKGVSACATCDGAFFRDEDLVVVGGGDTAMEEANYLTRFAKKVTVVHRRESLRASKIMQDRAMNNPKIEFIWDTGIEEILGEDKVVGVKLKNLKTGETSNFDCGGVFVAIGHKPNTDFLKGHLELDETGYIKLAKLPTTQTGVPGVFAAGDVHDKIYRQAVTAAGSGCAAAIDTERYLEGLEHP